jgi:hypothetical protein
VKNTVGMTDALDLGVVSFGTVLISSGYMLGVLSAGGSLAHCGKWIQGATTASHVFVALNYLLGSFIGFTVLKRPGFGVYCVLFTLVWCGIAYYGNIVMHFSAYDNLSQTS